jgi:hypothetical protein
VDRRICHWEDPDEMEEIDLMDSDITTCAIHLDTHDRKGDARITLLIIPLLTMAVLASYIAALGLHREWAVGTGQPPLWRLEQVVSAALHLSWICCAAYRRGALVTAICWAASVFACECGLSGMFQAEHSMGLAIVIEGIPLLLAKALRPSPALADRLAGWRRAQSNISVQLRMSEGFLSWLPGSLIRFFKGSADTPVGSSYRRFLAEMADAEHKLHVRLNSIALPEHLRQSILTSAITLVNQAEKSAAILANDLERHALSAAAICRDQCEELHDLQPQERAALARQCETLFLDLVHSAQPLHQPKARSIG